MLYWRKSCNQFEMKSLLMLAVVFLLMQQGWVVGFVTRYPQGSFDGPPFQIRRGNTCIVARYPTGNQLTSEKCVGYGMQRHTARADFQFFFSIDGKTIYNLRNKGFENDEYLTNNLKLSKTRRDTWIVYEKRKYGDGGYSVAASYLSSGGKCITFTGTSLTMEPCTFSPQQAFQFDHRGS